jgi:type II secretory ATPase GspE/PulE/Tfp pilus assembly ATPase PilB-like protein
MGFSSTAFPEDTLEAINADLSGVVLLDSLLNFILRNRLTSLSLQPLGDAVLIRSKRGETSTIIGTLAPNHYPEFSLRLRKLATVVQSGIRAGSGLFSFTCGSREASFQVSTMQGVGGDLITIRLQIDTQIPNRLVELHLPQAQESAFAALACARRGITFFASRNSAERERFMDLMLEETDTASRNVLILGEGPGGMTKRFPLVPLPESSTECARLIMDSLDHDPDILLLKDVTEGPTFNAACRAAMRGKRVLAGLDIRGTRAVVQYLLQQRRIGFLPLFANGVVSVVGIQLLCPACRVEYSPLREELAAMQLEQTPPVFYHSKGCDDCGYTGFRARSFLVDVLPFDDRFLQVFEQSADVAALDIYLRQTGYCGIDAEGLELLKRGEISPEEYIRAIIL